MKTKLKFAVLALAVFLVAMPNLKADEGMWIPLLLEKYNIKDMQAKGFKLSAEDVYSVNNASLKDAIVIFGGGCTGEIISDQGLLITNHHCGFGAIQKHSSVEHDYLTDGFWAMSKEEELPNERLSVTFLVRIEDVSDAVLKNVSDDTSEEERAKIINGNISQIRKDAVEGTHYSARVAAFFSGNQYFLFVNETYRDVRLVGAPPSAIGKFGGETDNWIWPRHTGDFSIFRIYADKDNKPADYSDDNVPYKPKKHLPISLKGVDKGDFTMVFGYPGSTTEYVPAAGVESSVNSTIPVMIDLRTKRLDVILAAMETSPKIRIQYAAKKSGMANGWKKNQGILKGLKTLNAINRKKDFEKDFQNWVESDQTLKSKYGDLLEKYNKIINDRAPFALANTYTREAGLAPEIFSFAGQFGRMAGMSKDDVDAEILERTKEMMKSRVAGHFKNYHAPTDMKLVGVMYEAYSKGIDPAFKPELLKEVEKKYQGDFGKYAADLFSSSIFADEEKVLSFIDKFSPKKGKKILNDPAYKMFMAINEASRELISSGLRSDRALEQELQRKYMAAQMEMQPDRVFYPDANFTLRVTYGQVDNFFPRDGIKYKHYTTLKGIIEKDNPDIYDYRVPTRLKELYQDRNYGIYGKDGEMPVCFIASNHTSGGNSGSPVINSEGHLIGVNFDRNWEGTMSDIMYDPDLCRNISIDIRYALFIIDKFAGAGHLVDEMDLVR